jgi:uncharacterized membrane protein YeaQ/YmgE (transglycosylase-associated protein family)
MLDVIALAGKAAAPSAGIWVDLGAICLGTVIGWLLRFFVQGQEGHFTFKIFVGVISVITGGVVMKFLAHFQAWAYCVGLLIGVIAFRWITRVPASTPSQPPTNTRP